MRPRGVTIILEALPEDPPDWPWELKLVEDEQGLAVLRVWRIAGHKTEVWRYAGAAQALAAFALELGQTVTWTLSEASGG